MKAKQTESATYEEMVSEIEAIISKLEQGKVPLEESVTLYTGGISLIKKCNQSLERVEKELEIIQNSATLENEV